MLSLLFTATVLLLVRFSSAAVIKPRADSFKLYAYGSDIPEGLSVFIADGVAYAGTDVPADATSIANITLSTEDSTSGTWTVTTDSGDSFAWGITNSGGDLETVGIVNSTTTMTTSGFGLYGAWAYHLSDAGEIQMNYRAVPTGTEGLYAIKWAAASTTVDDSALLINLRTASPVPISDKN
ncbi:acyl-synthetase [Diplodia corticola]|uniref:Acyl-synthetase n=1 Tax=Diplodia corticola TaxID=236234 RepID=A0A1J9RQI6_9PEZI|nr:acyl-synthetase [Diplodia corticola]OJD30711.1 acyl-synthetase [Diplodia corticola]